MIKKLLAYLQIFGFIFFIASCVTNPAADSGSGLIYKLVTKAKVLNKANDESYNIDLTMIIDANRAIRIDMTALLGYRLAELTMTPEIIQYIQREDKIFVQGPYSSKTLRPLFKSDFDPQLIWDLAHDKNFENGIYYGADVKTEFLKKSDSNYLSKKVTIENKNLKLIWLFKSKDPIYVSYNETFVLSKPSEYMLISIK